MFEDAVHHLIVQPDDGIDPILKTLNGAIKSLDIKMFQFTDPVLIGAVVNAHKRGIKVRVMLNPSRFTGGSQSRSNYEVPQNWLAAEASAHLQCQCAAGRLSKGF